MTDWLESLTTGTVVFSIYNEKKAEYHNFEEKFDHDNWVYVHDVNQKVKIRIGLKDILLKIGLRQAILSKPFLKNQRDGNSGELVSSKEELDQLRIHEEFDYIGDTPYLKLLQFFKGPIVRPDILFEKSNTVNDPGELHRICTLISDINKNNMNFEHLLRYFDPIPLVHFNSGNKDIDTSTLSQHILRCIWYERQKGTREGLLVDLSSDIFYSENDFQSGKRRRATSCLRCGFPSA